MTPELEAMRRLGVRFSWFNAELASTQGVPVVKPVWLVEGAFEDSRKAWFFYRKHLCCATWPQPQWPPGQPATYRHPANWPGMHCVETDRGFWVGPQ